MLCHWKRFRKSPTRMIIPSHQIDEDRCAAPSVKKTLSLRLPLLSMSYTA